MNKPVTDNAIKFMDKNPTFIGTVAGFDFYEHPTLGDETTLRVITPEGKVKDSGCYELPSFMDGFSL